MELVDLGQIVLVQGDQPLQTGVLLDQLHLSDQHVTHHTRHPLILGVGEGEQGLVGLEVHVDLGLGEGVRLELLVGQELGQLAHGPAVRLEDSLGAGAIPLGEPARVADVGAGLAFEEHQGAVAGGVGGHLLVAEGFDGLWLDEGSGWVEWGGWQIGVEKGGETQGEEGRGQCKRKKAMTETMRNQHAW